MAPARNRDGFHLFGGLRGFYAGAGGGIGAVPTPVKAEPPVAKPAQNGSAGECGIRQMYQQALTALRGRSLPGGRARAARRDTP